ncbi:MAG: DUF5721 family protein [Lachnospiraceae bacterium]|nr:DUF5721 family protein [Lachnospiraceae bacterium]
MIVIKIIDIKNFMAHLLLQDTFDRFLLFEAKAVTSSELVLKGKRHENWYDSEQWEQMRQEMGLHDYQYMRWGEIREMVFHFIKGKKSPDKMYIDLETSEKQRQQILESICMSENREMPALRLQIRFEKGELLMVPVVSYPVFTMDKPEESLWEEALQSFLRHYQIAFEKES